MSKPKKEGFLRQLFLGEIKEQKVFPFPRMAKEELEIVNMISDSLRAFNKEIDQDKIDREEKVPAGIVDKMKELGLFGLIIPEEYEGMGLSVSGYARVLEDLSTLGSAVGVTIGAHQSIGMKGLLLAGTPAQKAQYLPQLASGEMIAAFCLTEPNAGSDAASVRTRAELSSDGTHYLLSGEKQFITNGGIANFFTVFAQTAMEVAGETQDRITALIVTRDMGGVRSGAEEGKLGWHGSSTTSVYFDKVPVPVANVLGEVGGGFKVAMEILNNGRLSTSTGSLGVARMLINMCISYAKNRKQFGRPIGEFEMIKEKIAEMSMWAYVMDSVGYMTAGLVDRGETDYSIEAAVAKVFSTEALWKIADHALQIHGGMGYMRELPIERILRDARLGLIVEGTSEISRAMISLEGLRSLGQFLKETGIKGYAQKALTSAKLSKHHALFNTEASLFARGVDKLNSYAMRFLREYKREVIYKQFHQKRIAETMIDLYGMICTISRTTSLLKTGRTKEQAMTEIYLTRSFCRLAFERLEARLNQYDLNHDKYLARIADTLYADEAYKCQIKDLGTAELEALEKDVKEVAAALAS